MTENFPSNPSETRQLNNTPTSLILTVGILLAIIPLFWWLYQSGALSNMTTLSTTMLGLTFLGVFGILFACTQLIGRYTKTHKSLWEHHDQLQEVSDRFKILNGNYDEKSKELVNTKQRHLEELVLHNDYFRLFNQKEDVNLLIRQACEWASELLLSKNAGLWEVGTDKKLRCLNHFDASTNTHTQKVPTTEQQTVIEHLVSQKKNYKIDQQLLKFDGGYYLQTEGKQVLVLVVPENDRMNRWLWLESKSSSKTWEERAQRLGVYAASSLAVILQDYIKDKTAANELATTKAEYDRQIKEMEESHANLLEEIKEKHTKTVDGLNEKHTQTVYELGIQHALEIDDFEDRTDRLDTAVSELTDIRSNYQQLIYESSVAFMRFEFTQAFQTGDDLENQIQLLLEGNEVVEMNPLADKYLYVGGGIGFVPNFKNILSDDQTEDLLHQFVKNQYHLDDFEVKRYITKEGSKTPEVQFLNLGLQLAREKNKVKGFWLVAEDITAYKTQAEYYQALTEQSDNLVTVIDRDNLVVFESEAVTRKLGYGTQERKNISILSLIHPDDFDKVEHLLSKVIGSPERTEKVLSIRYRHSNKHWVEADWIVNNYLDHEFIQGILIESRFNEARTQIEHSLRRKSTFFQTLTEDSQEIISVVNEKGDIFYESPKMEETFGYSNAMRIGGSVMQYIHADYVDDVERMFHKVSDIEGLDLEQKIRFIDAKGIWKDVILRMHNFRHKDSVEGVVVSFKDISSQIKQEKMAQRENQMFRNLVQGSSTVYILTDKQGDVLFVNNAINSTFHYNPKELLGENLVDLVHESEEDIVRDHLRKLQADPSGNIDLDMKLRNRFSEWRQVEISGKSIYQKEVFVGFLFSVKDVTQKQKEDLETAFRARFFKAIVQNTSHLLVFVDNQGEIKYVNPSAKERLGYQLKGKLTDWLHSEDQEALEQHIADASQNTKYTFQIISRLMDKEGQWMNFEINGKNALQNSSFKGLMLEFTNLPADVVEAINFKPETLIAQAMSNCQSYAYAIIDQSGTLVTVDETLEALLNYIPGELFHKNVSYLLDDKSKVEMEKIIENLNETPDRFYYPEFTIRSKSGEKRVFESTITGFEKQEQVAIILRDVTYQQAEMQNLVKDEVNYRRITENVAMAAGLIAADGEILSMNPLLEEVLIDTHVNNIAQRLPSFVMDSEEAHFNSLLAEAWESPQTVLSGEFMLYRGEHGIMNSQISFKNLSQKTEEGVTQNYPVFIMVKDVSEVKKSVVNLEDDLEDIRLELMNTKTALEEAESKLTSDKGLVELVQDQILDYHTHVFVGDHTAGLVEISKEPLSEIEQIAPSLPDQLRDIEEVLNQYAEITSETEVEAKLQEIDNLKTEVGFGEIIPELVNGTWELKTKSVQTQEVLRKINGFFTQMAYPEIKERINLSDVIEEFIKISQKHPTDRLFFGIYESKELVTEVSPFRFKQLIHVLINWVKQSFTLEEVKFAIELGYEAQVKITFKVFEENIDLASIGELSDTDSVKSLHQLVINQLSEKLQMPISVQSEKANYIEIALGVKIDELKEDVS